MNVRLTATTN